MKPDSRLAVSILKIIVIMLFVLVSNQQLNLFHRIEELHYNFEGYTGVIIFALLWTLCLAAIYSTAFLRNTYARIALAALIAISTLVGFSYELIAGAPISYDSFSILWDAKSNAGKALAFYGTRVFLVTVVCFAGFLAIALLPSSATKSDFATAPHPIWQWVQRVYLIVSPVFVISPIIVIFAISLLRGGAGTGGMPIQYKVPSIFSMFLINNAMAREYTREQVSIPITKRNKQPHIVLIVDESVRGDYLDINLNRGVTPVLFSSRHRLVNYGYATSASNCSTSSNLALRMGATPENFLEGLRTNPYIWDYALHAGYRTILMQAQIGEGQLTNNMTPDEGHAIDEFIYTKGETPRERDLNAAHILKEKLKESKPSFIYVNKAGAHFPYEDAYDLEEALYKPHLGKSEIGSAFKLGSPRQHKALLINSYKNAVQLSVDRFFKTLLTDASFENTIIIYTSDHGQNLLDTDAEILHCTTTNTTPFEALIPLMIFTDAAKWRQLFEAGAASNINKASHFNIVPTILKIFGYDTEQVTRKHGQSLFADIVSTDRFASGLAYYDYRLSLNGQNEVRWNKGIGELISLGKIGTPESVKSP